LAIWTRMFLSNVRAFLNSSMNRFNDSRSTLSSGVSSPLMLSWVSVNFSCVGEPVPSAGVPAVSLRGIVAFRLGEVVHLRTLRTGVESEIPQAMRNEFRLQLDVIPMVPQRLDG